VISRFHSRAIACKSGPVDISKGKQFTKWEQPENSLTNSTPLKTDFAEYLGVFKIEKYIKKLKKLHGLSPRANYTD
jgi:hypothetical protein